MSPREAEILTEVDAVLGIGDGYPLEDIPGHVATLRARAEKAEQENARLSIKLTVSEQDVEHWAASNATARAQLRSLLDFAEHHHLSHADHGHDCYELWCIERDYTRRVLEEAPDA